MFLASKSKHVRNYSLWMPSDLRVCCKYQLSSRGRRQLTSSGEKQLEADVAVAALGTFVSLSQANNVGEGICAVFVFTSSSPTVLPHRVTQSGAQWLCLHQLGSWDNTLSCSDTAAGIKGVGQQAVSSSTSSARGPVL